MRINVQTNNFKIDDLSKYTCSLTESIATALQ